jgi:tRNA(Ile)-lysidine synthase
MPLLNDFIHYIKVENLFQKHDRLLLAVSGGVDSVVLCDLCDKAGFQFEIAHCNFQLRGEESERDEDFVDGIAKKYGVNLFVKKFDTKAFAEKNKISIQVAARELRYEWFEELIKTHSPPTVQYREQPPYLQHRTSYILTAHHANDNVETLLMNFFKGSGIAGLHGMLPRNGKIVRPLLFATREEIFSYLKQNQLEFVEDSSNLTDKYTRNYFRHELIPSIQKVFPKVEENLVKNIERFREIELLYQQSIDLHKKKLLEKKGNEVHIPVLKLLKAEPLQTILFEIIKDFSFSVAQTDEVIKLLKSGSGKYVSSSTHKILKNRNWLIISPINTLETDHIIIDQNEKKIVFQEGVLKLRVEENNELKVSADSNIAMLDAKNITFPLLLRKWKQGDYFYPLGMKKKKKVSKFFIDQKMSITEKENTWILESNKRILWIIGKRIDDRFKIIPSTKEVLEIRFIEKK